VLLPNCCAVFVNFLKSFSVEPVIAFTLAISNSNFVNVLIAPVIAFCIWLKAAVAVTIPAVIAPKLFVVVPVLFSKFAKSFCPFTTT